MFPRAWVVAALLLMPPLLQAQGTRSANRPAPRLQRGVTVRPETVTVGDPFLVAVRIRAASGATIEFPSAPDSGGAVEGLDPVRVTQGTDTTAIEQTALYRLAAWDVGTLQIPLADVLVRDTNGEHRVPLTDLTIFVRSVLPADTTQWIPKPQRDVLDIALPWWWWLIAALAAAGLIALLIWWIRRRRRRRVDAPPLAPFDAAEREFARVEALGLVAAGERARHAALMTEVLRDYLARVAPLATPSLTTTELLAAVRHEPGVPVNRLAALMSEVDLVKFARRPLTAERATALGVEARTLVRDINEAKARIKAQAGAPTVQDQRAA